MRKFVICFAIVAPLLLWLSATLLLILTAPVWLNLPGCCAIDNAAVLTWLSVLAWTYAVFILPAAAAGALLFTLHQRFGCFELSSMALSLLTAVVGSSFASYKMYVLSSSYAGLGRDTLIVAGVAFGVVFTTVALSALIARRVSRVVPRSRLR